MESPDNPIHSLIIPVYRSASFIERSLDEVLDCLVQQDESYEVLAVDDGSPDRTWQVLEEYAARRSDPHLRLLRHEQNRGKGMAVRTGVGAARGRFIYFIDADLTYPVSSLEKLSAELQAGADLAIACRTHPDSLYVVAPSFFSVLLRRHISGRIFNLLVRFLLLPGIRDSQAGLKGFRADTAKRIFGLGRLDRFSFDVELLYLARKLKLKIAEVGVTFIYRKEPSSVQFFQDSIRMFRDMLRIRWWDFRGRY